METVYCHLEGWKEGHPWCRNVMGKNAFTVIMNLDYIDCPICLGSEKLRRVAADYMIKRIVK
jgi:hypothetical protein